MPHVAYLEGTLNPESHKPKLKRPQSLHALLAGYLSLQSTEQLLLWSPPGEPKTKEQKDQTKVHSKESDTALNAILSLSRKKEQEATRASRLLITATMLWCWAEEEETSLGGNPLWSGTKAAWTPYLKVPLLFSDQVGAFSKGT